MEMNDIALHMNMSHKQACLNLEKASQFITQVLQMNDIALHMNMSHKQACLNLEKASQFITQVLQHEVARNQELCVLIRRLEEKEADTGRSLTEQAESNRQLRQKIDELQKRVKEKDNLLGIANEKVGFLCNELGMVYQEIESLKNKQRTLGEVNEWLQDGESQIKVEVVSSDGQTLLEAPVSGIKEDADDDEYGQCSWSGGRTDPRTEQAISAPAEIKTELIQEEEEEDKSNLATVLSSETDLSPTDPVSLVSPTDPVSLVSPADPVSLVSPTDPVSLVSPADPVSLVSPTDPLSLMSPTDPVSLVSPTDPVSLVSPTDPVSLVSPADTLSLVSPTDPVSLVSPTDPLSLVSPADPVSLVSPADPLSLMSPTDPLSLVSPADPVSLVSPADPLSLVSPADTVSLAQLSGVSMELVDCCKKTEGRQRTDTESCFGTQGQCVRTEEDNRDGEQPESRSPQPDERKLLSTLSGLRSSITELTTLVNDRFNSMEDRLTALEERNGSQVQPPVEKQKKRTELNRTITKRCNGKGLYGENAKPRKRRRVHSPTIAEAVRRLHNSETNTRRYEPEQGLTSPHNEAVTSHLLRGLSASPDLHDADKDTIVSACKTYYETLRRSFRYKHPDLALQAEAVKNSARSRSRRKRLLEARRSVLAAGELDVWRCATVDLMSDEEDGVVDGVSGWIVRPPPFRSPELSELCATLQSRLEADPKYRAAHHRRLHVGSVGSDRIPLAPHSSEVD